MEETSTSYKEIKNEESKDESPSVIAEKVKKSEILITSDRSNKKSAYSLTSIREKKEILKTLSENVPDEIILPENDFTEKDLFEAWDAYTDKIKSDGKFNLLSHLTMGKPSLKGSTIHLEFPNNTIKVEVERAQYDLLLFIKEKLQNFSLILEISVNETVEKKYAYTPQEKYSKLLEINPLIDELRKKLHLDL